MKLLKMLGLMLLLLAGKSTAQAQVIADPTTWTYEVKKVSGTEYLLICHVTIKAGWHLWSLNPGGDGFQIVPSFTFDNNAKMKLKGKVTEKGKPTTATIAGVDGKVTYMSGKVDYTQAVTVTGPCRITGKQEYQACNDKMCLPPADKDLVFDIK